MIQLVQDLGGTEISWHVRILDNRDDRSVDSNQRSFDVGPVFLDARVLFEEILFPHTDGFHKLNHGNLMMSGSHLFVDMLVDNDHFFINAEQRFQFIVDTTTAMRGFDFFNESDRGLVHLAVDLLTRLLGLFLSNGSLELIQGDAAHGSGGSEHIIFSRLGNFGFFSNGGFEGLLGECRFRSGKFLGLLDSRDGISNLANQ